MGDELHTALSEAGTLAAAHPMDLAVDCGLHFHFGGVSSGRVLRVGV